MALEVDYLVVGAGAAGLAFADALVARTDATVLLVDRRRAVGGHWNDVYPFLRLHLPSATYGVDSRALDGEDTRIADGPEAGEYARATGPQVRAYFHAVLDEHLLPTCRVRFLGGHEHVGGADGRHRLTELSTGRDVEVVVRRRLVDATYLENRVPATTPPAFPVADGARVLPPGALAELDAPPQRAVVLGSGKTAMDSVLWLLDAGVDPDAIRWVRPRDPYVLDRSQIQPFDGAPALIDGTATDLEAVAEADSIDDLLGRLEAAGRLLRLDPDVEPSMYRCAIVSRHELERLRSVRDVVRLGRVERVAHDRIALERGDIALSPDDVVVNGTAPGIARRRPIPTFAGDRITLQQIRACTPTFNAALAGAVEATGTDDATKNALCPAVPYPTVPRDWLAILANSLRATMAWPQVPEVATWIAQTRLNLFGAVPHHAGDPRVQDALGRMGRAAGPASAAMARLLA